MTIKITTPNGGSDSLDFGCAQTPNVAAVTGTEVSSGEGKLELKTTTGGTSATKATILANGRVGIGTATVDEALQVNGAIKVTAGMATDTASTGAMGYQNSKYRFISWGADTSTKGAYGFEGYSSNGSVNATHLAIDATGNVLVGTTTLIGDSSRLNISYTYTNSGIGLKSNTASAHNAIMFTNTNGTVGTITTSGSSTAYNTSSDYRLKENVQYEWSATERLKKLKPAQFNFLSDPDNTVDGFLAHEAQEVVPEAVTGVKDEVDDDDKPVMQGIDQSKLVPLLVKTIQELEARIAKLEEDK